jgi:SAM-dependent methyltransferase
VKYERSAVIAGREDWMKQSAVYIMENEDEAIRLEAKTDREAVKRQAMWCGIKPGMHILDAGCGPGLTTSILNEMAQPGGSVIGVDYSEKRIAYANDHYSGATGISFHFHDLGEALSSFPPFDLVWVRFVLEYHRIGSIDIIKNVTDCLKPGGYLCLLDLDYNCLSHYQLPHALAAIVPRMMERLDHEFNFDTYAGRKLYSYLYDAGYEDIEVELQAHHLIYGHNIKDGDIYNWFKKVEICEKWLGDLFSEYPGGYEAFTSDFKSFFLDPRRFTYTPLILCKGRKPRP